MKATSASVFVLLLLLLAPAQNSRAQEGRPRFGIGFNTLASTADGFGIGLRGRASAPVNRDLSIGIDVGATGFVLNGRRNATWVFDPQLSAIITVPRRRGHAMYYLAGIGAYVPLSDDDDLNPDNDPESGPTVHGGIGWVRRLTETTVFYEFNPALVVAEETVHLAVPFRFGIIF